MDTQGPLHRRQLPLRFLVAGAVTLAVLLATGIGWLVLSGPEKPAKATAATAASAPPIGSQPPVVASSSPAPSARPSSASPRPSPSASTRRPAGAFPDASSTGVPPGTKLRTVGELTITKAGTVIDGVRAKCILIWASHVTVKNSLVRGGVCGSDRQVEVAHGATAAVIEDTEIDGAYATASGAALGGDNFTCRRCNIHGSARGLQVGSDIVLQDSYVHDLYGTANSENSAFVSNGGSHIVVRHNTLFQNTVATGGFALALIPDFEVLNDILVEQNLINGGTYGVWAGEAASDKNPAWEARNTRFLNNAFGRKYFAKCGYYGPAAGFPEKNSGNKWSGNYWSDTHKSIVA